MNAIEARMRQIDTDIARQREREHRAKEDIRVSLLDDAWNTYNAVNNVISNSAISRAVQRTYCVKCPCVRVWRIDHKPHIKIAEFQFSRNGRQVFIKEGSVSKIVDRNSYQWAAEIVTERIAHSFHQKKIAIHPFFKWFLIALGVALSIPIAIGALAAIAQILFGLAMFGICIGVFVGLFES